MTQPVQRDEATQTQVDAADPRVCTWLSANAGSGKTRVLTDRVARLLLDGAPPENILCLTYTTAAASEMQNRLFRRLGEWAMLEDDRLRRMLAELGVEGALDTETLAQARRLFARAIETPGGLKIQTIHSFCAGLLRRFPLEAGLTPGFSEMDDATTAALQTEVLDRIATEAPQDFAAMAALVTDTDMTTLCAELSRNRAAFPQEPDPGLAFALFGLDPDFTEEDRLAGVMEGLSARDLQDIASVLDGQSATMQTLAGDLRRVAAEGITADTLSVLVTRCLYSASNKETPLQPKPSALTKGARSALGGLADRFDTLAAHVARALDQSMALDAAQRTLTLHRFAARFLPLYAGLKQQRGLLDFDDLIQKAEALLSNPAVADWVLYRLDGTIDHILVDEAQDTSPLQWRTIAHLTREMTAGDGSAGSREKTLFVVGDYKQSIYSFQGADPAIFGQMRDDFRARLQAAGRALVGQELAHSFRSAPEILRAVDLTFPPENRQGMGDLVAHIAFKDRLPGRVDLWPHIPAAAKADSGHWTDPVGAITDDHHTALMAERVAAEIRRMTREEVLWELDRDGTLAHRAVTEGDVLILVQSRGTLFHEIIAACKRQGLRVAGADVLRLGEELAVKDLLAALAFLATPEDDLSLAALLRSPLLDWSEAQLYELAAGRPQGARLWQTLRQKRDAFPDTVDLLDRLRNEADYLRPYDLLERILIRERGRQKLVGRLGEEATDGIDALLAQALAHDQDEIPSLTAFLARMQTSNIDVKRRAEGRGDRIRVMTVHGAKGLESPIVFLPDTGWKRKRGQVDERILAATDGSPIWKPRSGEMPRGVTALRDTLSQRRREEGQRLLYVAMTRAEQWLVVGAAGDLGKSGDTWVEQIGAGLDRAGAVEHDFGFGMGKRLQSPSWTAARPEGSSALPPALPALPDWATLKSADPERPEQTVSPSALGGAKALPGENAGLSEEEAMARGTRLHLLLEHLPGVSPDRRSAVAKQLLRDAADADSLRAEAEAVIDAPNLAHLFGPDTLAEVEVVAPLFALGGATLSGTIDKLVVEPDRVLAVDFKSNAAVPDTPEQVPDGLLRQMGAYAAALALIYPGRRIETALLWTRTATLMPLPEALTRAALAAAHETVSRVPAP